MARMANHYIKKLNHPLTPPPPLHPHPQDFHNTIIRIIIISPLLKPFYCKLYEHRQKKGVNGIIKRKHKVMQHVAFRF